MSDVRIGVDIDGVLADRLPAILEVLERRHGVSMEPEDVTDWNVTVPTIGREVSSFFAETDEDPDHIRRVDPIEGAIEGMQRLARKHTLLIATYRKQTARRPTIEWLESHDIPYDRYVRDVGEGKRNVPAAVLIDDSASTVRAFSENGGRAILFKQPWNDRESVPEDVPVADGWDDVLARLDD